MLFDIDLQEVRSLREKTENLRERVSVGQYGVTELEQFWSLVRSASFILQRSNPELSEAAGLGESFFSTVASQKRRPKLANMQRALTAIISEATERLGDEGAERSAWIPNPTIDDVERLRKVEDTLLALITQLQGSNALSEVPVIDANFRSHLITLLETTLALLKAPLIERSMLKRTAGALTRAASLIGEQSSAGFFGGLAGAAATLLLGLIV